MGQKESLPFAGVIEQLDRDREEGREGGLSNLTLEKVRIDEAAAKAFADYMRRREALQLKFIQLGGCGLTYAAFHHLVEAICSRAPSLKRLDLCTSDVPPEGNPLGTKSASTIGMVLRRCQYLTHLRLGNCGLDCKNVAVIAEELTNNRTLKTLDLSYNHIADAGAEKLGYSLQHNRSLIGLQLWKNHITSEGAEGLSAGLVINSKLQWLGLGCNYIGDEGVSLITDALTTNIEGSALVWLGLGNNHIGDKGAESLADLLSSGMTSIDEDEGEEGTACTLTTLGLGGNEITDLGVVQLAQALDRNEVLKSIGLSHNRISDDGAQALADMIRNNNTLEKLSLSNNDIGNEGGGTLIAALTQNTSLNTLLLAQNPIGDEVCDRCSEVFTKFNFSLQILDIKNTRITNKAFRRFVTHLKNSETKLRALGGTVPLEALDKNATLPASGNLLEIAQWRPPASSALMRRKLFEGVQMTERAHALLSLPTSALTPKALERRNSIIKEREDSLNQASKGFGPFSGGMSIVPEASIEEPDDFTGSSSDPPWSSQYLQVPAKFHGLTSSSVEQDKFQFSYSPDLRDLHVKGKKPTELRPMGFNPYNGVGRDALEEEDSSSEGNAEERETVFTNPSKLSVILRNNKGNKQQSTITEQETTFSGINLGGEEDTDSRVNTRARYSQEENRWVEERVEPEPLPADTTTRVRFNRDVEVMESNARNTAENDDDIEEDDDHRDVSWMMDSSETEWTTVEMMAIPDNVNLLGNKKKKRGSIIRSSRNDEDSEDENEVVVIDSEGEPSEDEQEDQPIEDQGRKEARESASFDEIQRRSLLSSPTRDRARPTGRRLPSISPSSSLGSVGLSEINERERIKEVQDETEELGVVKEEEEEEEEELLPVKISVSEPQVQILNEKPTRDQWTSAIKKRVGTLNMGIILQSAYIQVSSSVNDVHYVTTNARFPCNQNKNRQGAPLPPNSTRVKLQMVEDDLGSDYINASYLGSPLYGKSYIITQWPLESTIGDFWRMVWEQRVGVVVVLGEIEEEGNFWPKLSNHDIYPLVVNEDWSENALCIKTLKTTPIPSVEGMMEISLMIHSYDDNITDGVTLLCYPHWPANGVPQSAKAISHLFHKSLAARRDMKISSPMVVVSPEGGDIAGCFVAVSVAYELIQTPDPTPFDNDINILDSVFKGLSTLRPGLVTGQRQFDFSHLVIESVLSGGFDLESESNDGGKSSKKSKGFFRRKKTDSKQKPEKVKSEKKVKRSKSKQTPNTKTEENSDREALIF